jgi:hypothetical protein
MAPASRAGHDERLRARARTSEVIRDGHGPPPSGGGTRQPRTRGRTPFSLGRRTRNATGESTDAALFGDCAARRVPGPVHQTGLHPTASAGGRGVQRLRPAHTTGQRDTEERKAQGSIERRPVATPERLQRTLWRSKALRSSDRGKRSGKRTWQHGRETPRGPREQRREGTNRGDAGRLPGREKLRRACATGKGATTRRRVGKPETWRTPWPAAGCNRPARPCAE